MIDKKEPTLAQELAAEEERARRRFIYHTRPKGPMTMEEAKALSAALTNGERADGR